MCNTTASNIPKLSQACINGSPYLQLDVRATGKLEPHVWSIGSFPKGPVVSGQVLHSPALYVHFGTVLLPGTTSTVFWTTIELLERSRERSSQVRHNLARIKNIAFKNLVWDKIFASKQQQWKLITSLFEPFLLLSFSFPNYLMLMKLRRWQWMFTCRENSYFHILHVICLWKSISCL